MQKGQGHDPASARRILTQFVWCIFFVRVNNRMVSHSGVKGYLNTMKNTLKTDLGWRAYIIMGWERVKKKLCKKGRPRSHIVADLSGWRNMQNSPYLQGSRFNIWDSSFVNIYECLTRCIHGHECDCHNWTVINEELMARAHP